MKCPKCNNELPEGASFCNTCGERVDPSVVSVPATEAKNEQEPDNGTGAALPVLPELPEAPNSKPKKKSKLPLVLCIVLLLVLALGSVALYAMTFQKRDFLQFIQGKEKYARNLILDGVSSDMGMLVTALNAVDFTTPQITQDSLSLTSGRLNTSFGFTGSDSEKQNFINGLDIYDETTNAILRLFADSGVSASFAWGDDGESADVAAKWLLKGADVLSLDAMLRGGFVYMSAPQLFSKYLALETGGMEDLGLEDVFSSFNIEETDNGAAVYLQENSKTLENLVNDAAAAFMGGIKSIEVEDNVTLTLDKSDVKLDRVTYTLVDDEIESATKALALVIRNSEKYQDFVLGLVEYIQPGSLSRGELMDALDEMASESVYFTDELSVSLYVDAKNQVKAYSFEGEGVVVRYASVAGAGWELSMEMDDVEVKLSGSLEGTLPNVSGDMKLDVKSGFISVNLKILDFKFEDEKAVVSIPVGDILREAGKLVPIDLMGMDDFLNNSVLVFELSSNWKDTIEYTTSLKHKNGGLGIFFTVGAESLNGKQGLAQMPSESDISYIDMYTGEGIDVMEILTNLSTLVERIEGMGYNIDFIYELLGGLMGY